MKKTVLSFLLGVFVFVALHDYVIGYIDESTQMELLIIDSQRVSADTVCSSSLAHYNLHEILDSCRIVFDTIAGLLTKRRDEIVYLATVTDNYIPRSLYRPPIA